MKDGNINPDNINPETIARLADIAKLDLTPDEQTMVDEYLHAILGYISRINNIDTDGVEPCEHIAMLYDVYRDDEPQAAKPDGFDFRVPSRGREGE